jgi:predicted DCC family thiol-disulfide oxidoreductase YuxK
MQDRSIASGRCRNKQEIRLSHCHDSANPIMGPAASANDGRLGARRLPRHLLVMDPTTTAPSATVYYDGACPICSREIAQYRKATGADRLAFVDVNASAGDALGPGLTRDAAMARMHVRRADGTLVSGAAAFAELWRQLPGLAWAGRIAASPLVLPVLEVGYWAFLRLRRLWRG